MKIVNRTKRITQIFQSSRKLSDKQNLIERKTQSPGALSSFHFWQLVSDLHLNSIETAKNEITTMRPRASWSGWIRNLDYHELKQMACTCGDDVPIKYLLDPGSTTTSTLNSWIKKGTKGQMGYIDRDDILFLQYLMRPLTLFRTRIPSYKVHEDLHFNWIGAIWSCHENTTSVFRKINLLPEETERIGMRSSQWEGDCRT